MAQFDVFDGFYPIILELYREAAKRCAKQVLKKGHYCAPWGRPFKNKCLGRGFYQWNYTKNSSVEAD